MICREEANCLREEVNIATAGSALLESELLLENQRYSSSLSSVNQLEIFAYMVYHNYIILYTHFSYILVLRRTEQPEPPQTLYLYLLLSHLCLLCVRPSVQKISQHTITYHSYFLQKIIKMWVTPTAT